MRTTTGVLAIVQEGRFLLATDDGRQQLFLLSHKAAAEPQDLAALQRQKARVTVAFEEAEDLVARVACRITYH